MAGDAYGNSLNLGRPLFIWEAAPQQEARVEVGNLKLGSKGREEWEIVSGDCDVFEEREKGSCVQVRAIRYFSQYLT